MLIDFTVENYRSIKGPVTLSAVAQGRKAGTALKGKGRARIKPDHEIAPGYPVEGWGFELLPVLAIFGANASGKSNVVRALDDFLTFVVFGGKFAFAPREFIDRFIPFKLDTESYIAPTRFEIRVLITGKIYTYSMALNRERILSERLDYAQVDSKRNRRLFHRDWNEEIKKNEWKNGEDFKGPHTQLEASLEDEEPFMNVLHRFKIEAIDGLESWLKSRQSGTNYPGFNGSMGAIDDEQKKENVLKILYHFDTGLNDICPMKRDKPSRNYSFLKLKQKNELQGQGSVRFTDEIYAFHSTKSGVISWLFEEESIGTQRLLEFACYFTEHVNMLSPSALIIKDELDLHLHPNITRAIVKMFQDPTINVNRSQLIFTSHDSTLQRGNLLRRDQIWFTEKRSDGSTELYPLSDFKVRNDLAIDKAYLDGRFGAVPFLPDDEELISLSEG